MTVKYELVKAGDVLYDVHSYRMGNTTIRSVGVWEEVVEAARMVLAMRGATDGSEESSQGRLRAVLARLEAP